MSHEVLITRRQSIFIFFANPGKGGPQHPVPASISLLRSASDWICKKIRNALSFGYQDLMWHLILTTSPWSILTWITLVCMVRAVRFTFYTVVQAIIVNVLVSILIWIKMKANAVAYRKQKAFYSLLHLINIRQMF